MSAQGLERAHLCLFFQSAFKSLRGNNMTSASKYSRRASALRTWKVRMGITCLIEVVAHHLDELVDALLGERVGLV